MGTLTAWTWGIVAVDLLIVIAALCVLRFGIGLIFGVDTKDELSSRDNFAFGIALAGGVVAVAMVLAGAGAGESATSLLDEELVVAQFAVVGLVLLKLGLLLNDALLFNQISIKAAIASENIAAGIVQAANLVAIGILIRGAMNWVEMGGWMTWLSLVVVVLLSQVVLLGVTRLRAQIYTRRHRGARWQQAIAAGNAALALRYAGHLIGTALVASSAGAMLEPVVTDVAVYLWWLIYAVLLAAVLVVVALIARQVILVGVNVVVEVDEQKNIGVAAIEAAIYLGLGAVIQALLG